MPTAYHSIQSALSEKLKKHGLIRWITCLSFRIIASFPTTGSYVSLRIVAAVACWALAAPIMYKILTIATTETMPKGSIFQSGQLGDTKTTNNAPMVTNPRLQMAERIETHLKVLRFVIRAIVQGIDDMTRDEKSRIVMGDDYRALVMDLAMIFGEAAAAEFLRGKILRGKLPTNES